MTTGEVLAAVEGLTKDLLYYLEYRGYIAPLKRRAGRIMRNEYSAGDLGFVRRFMHYYLQDFPPRVAAQKARAVAHSTGVRLTGRAANRK